jgi:hypothetical protein
MWQRGKSGKRRQEKAREGKRRQEKAREGKRRQERQHKWFKCYGVTTLVL